MLDVPTTLPQGSPSTTAMYCPSKERFMSKVLIGGSVSSNDASNCDVFPYVSPAKGSVEICGSKTEILSEAQNACNHAFASYNFPHFCLRLKTHEITQLFAKRRWIRFLRLMKKYSVLCIV